jgi:hypothetical protein
LGTVKPTAAYGLQHKDNEDMDVCLLYANGDVMVASENPTLRTKIQSIVEEAQREPSKEVKPKGSRNPFTLQ